MWTLIFEIDRVRTVHRPVKWLIIGLCIVLCFLAPISCVSKCQKALNAAAAVTAQVLAENRNLAKELLNKQNRHFQLPTNDDQQANNQFFSPQNLPNILDSDHFDQTNVNPMIESTSLTDTNIPDNVDSLNENAYQSAHNNVAHSVYRNNAIHMGHAVSTGTITKRPSEHSLLVSQESRSFRARPNNQHHPKQLYNKINQQQFQLRGLINDENVMKFDHINSMDKIQFTHKPPNSQVSHKLPSHTKPPNQMSNYFSSQQTIVPSASSSFLNNLRAPYILHQGDVYVAYFDCIDQNNLNVERMSPLVQSAMSAVWAAHRLNQMNLSTSSMSIKLGVYYFDICNYNSNDQKDMSKEHESSSNSVDDLSNQANNQAQFGTNAKWVSDDKQIESYIRLIEYNSLNNFSSNNRNNGLGIVLKTGVRSYQRNAKQQVHKMRPIIGILCDVSRMHPQSVVKLNKIDLPVINFNQLADYSGWPAEPGVSLAKRLFNVYPAVQQLCKGVFSLVKKLNWTFAILDFSKFENTTSTNNNQVERKLTPQQQIFIRCLSKMASRDAAFTFRLDSTDGQSLENEIIFLTTSKSQIFMNGLVAGYLSNKPNRIIATLENLSAQLDTAIIEHHLAGKQFHLPYNRKGRSLEEFTHLNGPFFIQPNWEVTTDFFDFFNIELRNANIQSRHRLMSKLSEQLLFKAFNSSSVLFTENELNFIRPVVHYFKDNDGDLFNQSSRDVHHKFNKLNHNLTKLLKSRNLFEVTNYPAVMHVIKGVWTLGFTLAKLIKNVCIQLSGLPSIERKRNCMYRMQQVFDSDKQFLRKDCKILMLIFGHYIL